MIAACPHCHRRLNIDDQLIGQDVRCPACHETFHVDQSIRQDDHTPDTARHAPPPLPMGPLPAGEHQPVWYVPDDHNQPSGPFTTHQILEWYREGSIDAGTLCWRAGMRDWQALGQVADLRHFIRFRCSNEQCGSWMLVHDTLAGRQAKCQACASVMTIPSPGDSDTSVPGPAATTAVARDTPVRDTHATDQQLRPRGLPVVTISIVAVIIAVLALLWALVGHDIFFPDSPLFTSSQPAGDTADNSDAGATTQPADEEYSLATTQQASVPPTAVLPRPDDEASVVAEGDQSTTATTKPPAETSDSEQSRGVGLPDVDDTTLPPQRWPELVLWWSFDDGQPVDQSRNANHGTNRRQAAVVGGVHGPAAQFTGRNDHIVSKTVINDMASMSCDMWVYTPAQSEDQAVVEFSRASQSMVLYLAADTATPTVLIENSSESTDTPAQRMRIVASTPGRPAAWMHVAMTIAAGDSDTAPGRLRMYLDGALAADTTIHDWPTAFPRGRIMVARSTQASLVPFQGVLDELRLWRGVLTDAQVRQAATRSGTAPSADTSTSAGPGNNTESSGTEQLINPIDKAPLVFIPASSLRLGTTPGQLRTLYNQRSSLLLPDGYVSKADSDKDYQAFVELFDDEHPPVQVETGGIYMYCYEVTVGQYRMFCREKGLFEPPAPVRAEDEYRPMTDISLEEALAYAEWANARLPTEAEWELACCGTSDTIYPWGDDWPDTHSIATLAAVGSNPQDVSTYGVYDMAGNAAEWVVDHASPRPTGPKGAVIRGGGLHTGGFENRCAWRFVPDNTAARIGVGFRCVARRPAPDTDATQ